MLRADGGGSGGRGLGKHQQEKFERMHKVTAQRGPEGKGFEPMGKRTMSEGF